MLIHSRPYIIDLESTNGTYINNQRIDAAKYMELKEKVQLTLYSESPIRARWKGITAQ